MMKYKNIPIIGLGRIGTYVGDALLRMKINNNENYLNKITFIGHNSRELEAFKKDFEDALMLRYINAAEPMNILDYRSCFCFTNEFSSLKEADIIICSYGSRIKSNISDRRELLYDNDKITSEIAAKIKNFASNKALLLNIVNPLETLTWRLLQTTNLLPNNVIGISGTHDISRFLISISEVLKIPIDEINRDTLYIVGEHGSNMVPVLSNVKINNMLIYPNLTEYIKQEIIKRTNARGLDILKLRGTPPLLGPATSMITICKNLIQENTINTTCSIYHDAYKCYLTYPCTISGLKGVTKIKEDLILNDFEHQQLSNAIKVIKSDFNAINR